ncbi:MAG TPA: hypothetical protein VHS55_02530 [Solirubrobacteraceae bacterium]|nr:hypothetical protein [Solirubrobacteraceae bacterium]
MSVSTEVQRTLVKSPPELWAELGNPEALAKHLGELGEIRITAVEPESKVEWEADGATGVVELKQSGWGTKVTLSLTRQTPEAEAEPEPAATSAATEPEPEDVVEPVATAAEPASAVEPVAAVVEPESVPEPLSEPEPQLGFFARIFRKRKTKLATAVKSQSEPEPVEVEVVAMAAPEPIYPEPPSEPVVDLAAELASVEAQMTEESTELLTGVLDRLGAAHHRPFSRG